MNCSPADLDNLRPGERRPGQRTSYRLPAARSDVQASLDVIHAYFDSLGSASAPYSAASSLGTDGQNYHRHPDNLPARDSLDRSSSDNQLWKRLQSSLHESIVYKITHTTRPMDDDEFERRIAERHAQEELLDPDVGDFLADESSDSDDEKDEEPIVYEEEDLLDANVLERARAMREQLRTSSRRVATLRDSVLQRARNLYQDNERFQSFLEGVPNGDNRPSIPDLDELEDKTSSDAMIEALGSLRNALDEDPLSQVQTAADAFRDTMDVVRIETAEDRVLSQTELAIQSRTNSGTPDDPAGPDRGEMTDDSPEDVLIHFLHK